LATYEGIAAVSKAILGVLEDARATFVHHSTLSFQLIHLSGYETTQKDGVTLCLYRVALNASMRNAPVRRTVDPATGAPIVTRAPLPLDLYYLLTAWADDPEMQQRLLGWAMRLLHDTPVLPATLINAHTTDIQAFGAEESFELTLDQFGPQDWLAVWDKLKPKLQTTVGYVTRMIALESKQGLTEYPAVQTRAFEMAKKGPPQPAGSGR
jgi:hypothetical protein